MTPISLALVFETPDGDCVEPRHIEVLQAVTAAGSLTGAARRLGLSYRGVCNGVLRLNELFGVPLVEGIIGGAGGGGARLTPSGEVFLRFCGRLDARLEKLALDLHREIAGASREMTTAPPAETAALQ